MTKPQDWVDFEQAKKASFEVILRKYSLLERMNRDGDELKGFCPFHPGSGKKDSFSANVAKNVFHCFACKRKGSVIDFVAQMEKLSIKEAAILVLGLTSRADEEEQARREHEKASAETRAEMDAYKRSKGMETSDEWKEKFETDRAILKRRMEELFESIVEGAGENSCGWLMHWNEAQRLIDAKGIGAQEVVVIHIGTLMTTFLKKAYHSATLLDEFYRAK